MKPLSVGTRIDSYEILAPIGAGGMGEVYRALDLALRRTVAIKVISQKQPPGDGERERFVREARSLATVDHPHIVRIYSFGEAAGVPYLVMEYVDGENLADRLRRLGRLQVDEAVQITQQIARALDATWERGIVHRDIKPSNILIDSRERVRVVDFGLARPAAVSNAETALTLTTSIVGTPHYLSPEQARSESVDFKSDIYSLGILLFEMLAGAPPFQGSSAVELVAHHLHTPLPSLQQKRQDIPAGLIELVEQMTGKDPHRRPSSYEAILQSLAQSTAPVVPWKGGSPYRGLEAFDVEHAAIFFGRNRIVEEILGALRTQAVQGRAFILVVGTSGSGKSSLVRAGVLPRLDPMWRRAILKPGESAGNLFDGLASALMQAKALPELASDGTTATQLGAMLRDNPKGIALLVKGSLMRPESRLVLVIDQMEELFTLDQIAAADRDARNAFVQALAALASSERACVIGTLRSDYYARCEEVPDLMTLKEGPGQYHVPPPTAAEIGQMIRLPAQAAGLRFEVDADSHMGLDEVLRDAAAGQPGNLPLLEFALEELYRQRTPDGVLTYAAYENIGGIGGALSRRAEAVVASVSAAAKQALPRVLSALVRIAPGETRMITRRYARLDAFGVDERILADAFTQARLLTADRGETGHPVVTIAHEMLLQSWPRLQTWIDENRELLRVRGRVSAAGELWVENRKTSDLLLAEGRPLEEAIPLLHAPGIDVSPDERAFIEASAQRARARRRTRVLMNANSLLLLVGTAALFSVYLWRIVPLMVEVSEAFNLSLSLPVRLSIAASKAWRFVVPPVVVILLVLYFRSKRAGVSEFVRSGLPLAIGAGIALMLALISLLAGLFNAASLMRVFKP